VPSCPEWKVADLVIHTGAVHGFWGEMVERRAERPIPWPPADLPSDHALLVPWLREGTDRLASRLESADPSDKVWTWAAPHNVGWVQRRMAQETAVHRWDGEAGAGHPIPIDAELAVDGIDEFLDVFLPENRRPEAGPDASVHLHSTDAPGEWLVRIADNDVTVSREHAKGDAAVRGPASDLLLLLWRRVAPAQLEVFGAGATLDRFLAVVELD
jgi:uncharacterized protein (TIGR03083 family)